MKNKKESSSWEQVSSWYDKVVGSKGHYYHEHVILPKLKKITANTKGLLDLACGQGILSRILDPDVEYVGVDASMSLINAAKRMTKNKNHQFHVHDLTLPLNLTKKDFDTCTIILALQNIPDPLAVFKSASAHLSKNGMFIIILNHPYFRIPRQTSWQIDEAKKVQYRRVDKYMSPMKIPILAHPSQKEQSTNTWSYHTSLKDYSMMLKEAGFAIDLIDEWCSDKTSTGSKARMENRSREEFPLFMAIIAKKL